MQTRIPPALLLVTLAWAQEKPANPREELVWLGARGGWDARLLWESDSGVWTVKPFDVLPAFAGPEVVALDDRGRCVLLGLDSTRVAEWQCVMDGQWLAGVAHADIDPTRPGPELYASGKRGNLYQIVPQPQGGFDAAVIWYCAGKEIHTLVSADLDPDIPGIELYAGLSTGELHRLEPPRARGEDWRAPLLLQDPGRIRDAVLFTPDGGDRPSLVTVSRAGRVVEVRAAGGKLQERELHRAPQGLARIAAGRVRSHGAPALYVIADDGQVMRLERGEEGRWNREVIYAGAPGGRGVAVGRFGEDPHQETLAIFGYSGDVEILRRDGGGRWSAETVFTDRDKGHWLAAGELDDRNATDEIVVSGYGKRVILLSRPPGTGLGAVAVDARARPEPAAGALRVGLYGTQPQPDNPLLTPLAYAGGFHAVSLVYEGLVTTDTEGRLLPGLATGWQVLDEGRTYVLRLREGVRFHDGTLLTAEAVRDHLQRWIGTELHNWVELGRRDRIQEIEVLGPLHLRIRLREPYPLLLDLTFVRPAYIAGQRSPIGTGPYSVVSYDPGRRLLLGAFDRHWGGRPEAPALDIRPFDSTSDAGPRMVAALEKGRVDLIVDPYWPRIPRDDARRLAASPDFGVSEVRNSAICLLVLNHDRAPFQDIERRRRVARSIDRAALIERVENGYADPVETLFAPWIAAWEGIAAGEPAPGAGGGAPAAPARAVFLVRDVQSREVKGAIEIARQLRGAGIEVEVDAVSPAAYEERVEKRDFDLRLSRTWGAPYDPHGTLLALFRPGPRQPAVSEPRVYTHPDLTAAIEESLAADGEAARKEVYRRIQAFMSKEATVVSLYSPRLLAAWDRRRIDAFRGHFSAYALDLGGLGPRRGE